jgi:hypothetical protein
LEGSLILSGRLIVNSEVSPLSSICDFPLFKVYSGVFIAVSKVSEISVIIRSRTELVESSNTLLISVSANDEFSVSHWVSSKCS